jgi:hypothetical protein
MLTIEKFQIILKEFIIKYKQVLYGIIKIGIILFYHIFLGKIIFLIFIKFKVFALLHDSNKSFNLAIFTLICWLYIFYKKCLLPFFKIKIKIITNRRQYKIFYSFIKLIKNNYYFIRLFFF